MSGASHGAEILQALGRFLHNLGSLPQADFGNAVRNAVTQATSVVIRQAERLLDEKRQAPEYWQRDLNEYVATLQNAVTQNEFFVPSDLKGSLEERRNQFRDIVGMYGRLLMHWPTIMEMALRLRWEGYQIAQKLTS
jgi:hypothetical protein